MLPTAAAHCHGKVDKGCAVRLPAQRQCGERWDGFGWLAKVVAIRCQGTEAAGAIAVAIDEG